MNGLVFPQLMGGGLVMGYRCPSRCRHCLYGSGPHRRDGKPTLEQLDNLLDLLAVKAPRARFHVGGGEPFMDPTLLEYVVAGMTKRKMVLEYVETNAYWVKSANRAKSTLARLKDAGLECILISMSPFHAEFVPLARTLSLIKVAREALSGGAFVWIPEFAEDLSGHLQDRTFPLDEVLQENGDEYAVGLADRYQLIEGGRAGRYLAAHGRTMPWQQAAARAPCATRLVDTSHFHVDGAGLYVPGLCAGLAVPLEELPGPLDPKKYPVIDMLARPGGLERLVARASRSGFEPLDGYSSACDMCNHARFHLHRTDRSADLAPDGYYDERSLPGFF